MAAEGVKAPALIAPLTDWTLGGALAWLSALFKAAQLDSPGLDARRLIAASCGCTPGHVILRPGEALPRAAVERLEGYAARRLAREPVSRILGVRAFHGHDFEIGPATLDPRPETETLVDGVLGLVAEGVTPGGKAPRLLDLGTGSGAILLALLAALPDATGVGCDVSPGALEIAERNAARLGVTARCELLRSDWLSAVQGPFDIVVSNPPYIARAVLDGLEPEVRLHDPPSALDGGDDGLDPYRWIIPACGSYMVAGGWLAVEIGSEQAAQVMALGENASVGRWIDQRLWRDLAGKPRCVAMRHQS